MSKGKTRLDSNIRMRGYGQEDWSDMYPRRSKARQQMRRVDKRRARQKGKKEIGAQAKENE
jgi:hypothetical protein